MQPRVAGLLAQRDFEVGASLEGAVQRDEGLAEERIGAPVLRVDAHRLLVARQGRVEVVALREEVRHADVEADEVGAALLRRQLEHAGVVVLGLLEALRPQV